MPTGVTHSGRCCMRNARVWFGSLVLRLVTRNHTPIGAGTVEVQVGQLELDSVCPVGAVAPFW